MNKNNITTPVKCYLNAKKEKINILKENSDKSGIYEWNNLITGKSYIGSAMNLKKRLKDYFSINYLNKVLSKNKSLISSSLLKHGYDNFKLNILEYCDKSILLNREQHYIDTLHPKYNICRVAGSTFGKKHSPATILKIKNYKHNFETLTKIKIKLIGRKHSSETIEKIRIKLIGRKLSDETKAKLKLKFDCLVTVLNINNNNLSKYSSVSEAAKSLKVCMKTIYNYANTNKLLKNKYYIKKNNKNYNKVYKINS